ncbi:hypothetical protein GALL_547650 [mine drainage metagenome]|uniref:Uncharacterized protein n=1 Tax=mine drainage metagenome TaxID=410659 RepID=A0A1J5P7D3_9ZZZZ
MGGMPCQQIQPGLRPFQSIQRHEQITVIAPPIVFTSLMPDDGICAIPAYLTQAPRQHLRTRSAKHMRKAFSMILLIHPIHQDGEFGIPESLQNFEKCLITRLIGNELADEMEFSAPLASQTDALHAQIDQQVRRKQIQNGIHNLTVPNTSYMGNNTEPTIKAIIEPRISVNAGSSNFSARSVDSPTSRL